MHPLLLAAAAATGVALARRRPACPATRILRISRVVSDLDRAETFYRDGLGFHRVAAGAGDPAATALLGLAATRQVVLRLGEQQIALVAPASPGPPYPTDSRSNDLWFQHLAVVVDDMATAHRVLSRQAPQPISAGGPQSLPPRNGGVDAFKFRDPDGHPLELLHFPLGAKPPWQRLAHGPFLGIDHSALAISSARQSLAFYRALGFAVANRSFNRGPAQSHLDGLPAAAVHVTALRLPGAPGPGAPGPGLELLRYQPPGRPRPPSPPTACLTDWVTLEIPALTQPKLLTDPDGHILLGLPVPS